MYNLELKITGDNSHTLLVTELNETYHSTKGAINEALHVFIQKGLTDYLEINNCKEIEVFEVGFGTGLNAHLTQLFAAENNVKINYTSVEAYPLNLELIQQLNYTDLINSTKQDYLKLHEVEWNKPITINKYFKLNKLHKEVISIKEKEKFDVIFFDAFAPDIQPEMWSKTVFENMLAALKPNGVLVTYCAKGIVKRTIKELGFELETLAGPPGKREMIRATKRINQ
ncbi:MAG: tRNA (5-methylaminomethyl-2-thiouridine)(34)-methyltransferase MnmD [Flavobacteriales bacterium]